MKKRRIRLSLLAGVCLIGCSLLVTVLFQVQLHRTARQNAAVTAQLDALLPAKTAGITEEYNDTAMPVLEIDGTDYAALLEIPSHGVTLPIADRWEKRWLSPRVGRFCGSAYDGTLVIGGADHPSQFGFCDEIEHDTVLTVTDMAGAQFSYAVFRVDRVKNATREWLCDAESDLTLFCRDAQTFEYVAARCRLLGDS